MKSGSFIEILNQKSNDDKTSKNIYLTSRSMIKCRALTDILKDTDFNIIKVFQHTFKLPEQPINEYGFMCAKMRIDGCKQEGLIDESDYVAIISIESYMLETSESALEYIAVIIEYSDGTIYTSNISCEMPDWTLYQDYKNNITTEVYGGYSSTFGNYMYRNGHCDNPKDWFKQIAREYYIRTFIYKIQTYMDDENIYAYLDYFKDYPREGVIFTSMGSMMSNKHNFDMFKSFLVDIDDYNLYPIDYIIGLETRGIHIGALMSTKDNFDCGFQMARKAGKLPNKNLISTSYSTEYSKDAIELAPLKGLMNAKHILIVDDLIATGGSICAVAECIRGFVQSDVEIYCYAPLKVHSLDNQANLRFKENNIKRI